MNKIVRQHYPVDRLPADLKEGLTGADSVTVTLEAEPKSRPSLAELRRTIEEQQKALASSAVSADEAVARIRTLRDEWE